MNADWQDRLPQIDTAALPTVFADAAGRARTDGKLAHGQRRHGGRTNRQRFHNARKQCHADKMLTTLPTAGEVLHLCLDGAFDLCHLIPRIVDLAGEPLDALDLAKLGFNDATVDTLVSLSDAKRVKHIRLLASHYFRSVDAEQWGRAHEALTSRGHELFIARNHAKLQLYRFRSGRTVTLMSSANLRSCKNAEFAILISSPDVLAFWRGVIDELIAEAKKGAA